MPASWAARHATVCLDIYIYIYNRCPHKNNQVVQKRVQSSKNLGENVCEIKGGGHEITAVILMIYLNLIINIVTVISWPPPLISQFFSLRLFEVFVQLGCFCVDFTSFCILNIYPKANHKLA